MTLSRYLTERLVLIVPYGIEIAVELPEANSEFRVLIVPYGIEMKPYG